MEKTLVLNFKPVPKERPRASKWGIYTPKKTQNFENMVALEWKNKHKDIFDGAISVNLRFCLIENKTNLKKGIIRKCTKRPDIDNLIKSVLDGLNGVAFKDDSQITELIATKEYSTNDMIEISIKDC